MIASRTGLAVLAAIALVLAAIVVLEPRPQPLDRALAPGLDIAAVKDLQWGSVHLVRDDKGWAWLDPPGRADPATVDAVLAALRGAFWHRVRDGEAASATLVAGGRTFGLGPALGTQRWIVREHDEVLVDDWVVRALFPEPLALRIRHPFADPPPLAVHYAVAPEFLRDRAEAYAAVEVTSLPPCAAGSELLAGFGCVDSSKLAAAHALDDKPPPDPRPVPFAPIKIELPDHATIDLAKRPQLDGKDADPDRVAELVTALTSPAQFADLPAAKPDNSFVVTGAHGEVRLDIYGQLLARRGDPVALKLPASTWALLVRPAQAYRDTTRWLEDSATISSITIDSTTYTRGSTLGTWSGGDPALLEALASALATLRAPTGPAPTHVDHTITLSLTPPVGPARSHRLELGAHCAASADGEPIALPLAACTAATAAAAR